jgi:hypothetical protein
VSDLTRTELSWARATLETFFPSNACAALPEGIAALDIEGHLQGLRRRAPGEAAFGIRVAIWIVGLAPVFVLGRLCSIASLSGADRERVVRGVLASPVYLVRQLVVFLKQLGALLYAGADPIRERVRTPQTQGVPRLVSASSLSSRHNGSPHEPHHVGT